MISKRQIGLLGLAAISVAACTPTVNIKFSEPLQINAKLDADIRIKLDQELQNLLRENPNLF
ncbi:MULTISPECIES: YnbE family lipoprotein [unclassified Brevundimonas]|uniref:YnbE family lipoprotein n=1 Tax=unclassified Brevundimonas TaxID=2622653 RepID=UPI000CFC5AE4|nr:MULTISPECIES: YnbE family lipoprotein [unclassified Brevundimonas]PRA31123.1 YnbE family lipoprotein [Brevundimonas sp. MYb27]PQZ81392.1 YnbE family lipoprotein [Brevundimonas sp. MYb31]PRB12618.1 YnbE family lipoprotein [Brevundimonas sp. MYb52]PRB33451.1 YnbE family lipoprotein [Brevundimonas sp. MYb46]PRB51295.1 YnbE family lipoprotein [Brevundimonas sp. MYb33]